MRATAVLLPAAADYPPRPALPGAAPPDGAIVGAGYPGLWTPYYPSAPAPALRLVILER